MTTNQKQGSRQTKETSQKSRPAGRVGPGLAAQMEAADLEVLQRVASKPWLAAPADLLALQRSAGNRAVQKVFAQLHGDKGKNEGERTRSVQRARRVFLKRGETDGQPGHGLAESRGMRRPALTGSERNFERGAGCSSASRVIQRQLQYADTGTEVAPGSLMFGQAESWLGRTAIKSLIKKGGQLEGLQMEGIQPTIERRAFTHAGIYRGHGQIWEFWEKDLRPNPITTATVDKYWVMEAPATLNWARTEYMIEYLEGKRARGELTYKALASLGAPEPYIRKKGLPSESYCVDVVAMAYVMGTEGLARATLTTKMGVMDMYIWALGNGFGFPRSVRLV